MAKRQKPKAAAAKSRGTSRGGSSGQRPQIESSRNDEHPLPDDLAKAFDDLLSRSFQAAQAEQGFRSTMAQAAEELEREQARLMNALTQQMGVAAALQELESLRDRQNRAVIEAFETASSAILTAGGETGRRGESSRRRRR